MTPEEKKERKRLYDIQYRKKNANKVKENNIRWLKNNPEKTNEYTKKRQEKKRLYDEKYIEANKEKIKERQKKYYEKNKEKIKDKSKTYRESNKDKRNLRDKNKRIDNPIFRIQSNIRSSIRQSFKSNGFKKLTKTELILGCSYEQLKNYIESKFEPWMNWDNYGNPKDGVFEPNKTWDLDHIVPTSNANNVDELLKLNHYTNLQPLCSYTNRWVKINN